MRNLGKSIKAFFKSVGITMAAAVIFVLVGIYCSLRYIFEETRDAWTTR